MRSLTPDQVGIRSVGEAARNGGVDAAANAEESFRGPFSGDELAVARIDVAGQQMRAVGIGARHDQCRHAQHIGSQTGRDQLLNGLRGRHQNLSAEVSALLGRGELIFEMHASRAGLDHRLHQFEGVQGAAESGFGIGHDGGHPVDTVLSVEVVDLVGAHQGVVDAANDIGNAVGRVQALIGIHLARVVGVGGDLPTAEVDGLQAGLHLLHRLVAGERAESGHVRFVMQQPPEPLRAQASQSVLDLDRAAQLGDILWLL